MKVLGEINIVRARKKHHCTASVFVVEMCDEDEMRGDLGEEMFLEWKTHEQRGCVILPGEKYYSYACLDGSDFYHCKEAQIARKICEFYDLWEC